MTAPIPDDARDLVTSAVPVVVSYRDAQGRIISWPLWAEVADGLVRFSTEKSSRKAAHLRRDPEMGFLFLDASDPYRYLSVSGRVVAIEDEADLATIDRLARRYQGSDYEDRGPEREVFVVEPTRVVYTPGSRG